MSTDLYLTNENNKNNRNKHFNDSDIKYLNTRLSYLEKIIESKYSDILNLASEISNLQNLNLKYDLVDVLIKHGSNLTKYKAELVDVKDMLSYSNRVSNDSQEDNNLVNNNIKIETAIKNDIENIEPHNSHQKDENIEDSNSVESLDLNKSTISVIENNITNIEEKKEEDTIQIKSDDSIVNSDTIEEEVENKTGKVFPIRGLKLKGFKKGEDKVLNEDEKKNAIKQKIITNLDKLISYKENTFNDLIEIVGFNIDSSAEKVDLSIFIEALENQIVELNQYKNNILNGHSLSKSIELGSNGKITFSRIFIEKDRLLAKDKDTYISVLTNMYNLYSEFVDNYLKNINYMKPHLSEEKIKSMQTNCGKVIYDFKLIRTLYSSLNNAKGV